MDGGYSKEGCGRVSKRISWKFTSLFCCPKVLKFLVMGLFSGSSWDSSKIFLYAYRVDTEKEENIIWFLGERS
jgi:hypothetical protein